MTTLSTPVKVIALAGLALILGAGGLLMLTSKKSSGSTPVVPPVKVVHVTPATHKAVSVVRHAPKPVKPKVQLNQDLPAPVAHKLMLSKTVVAFVYTGASVSDRALLGQARAGAHTARVPFVALNVADERTALAVHGWADTSADPIVLVVKRPGSIAFMLEGPTDSQVVAQVAANVR